MARTVINPQASLPLGSYPTLPISAGGADIGFTANSDPTDRFTPIVDNKTLLLAYNSDSVARTITIGSAADTPFNRKGDITAYSVAAGKVACFGPFKTAGWANTGNLNIDVSDAHLLLAVVTLP